VGRRCGAAGIQGRLCDGCGGGSAQRLEARGGGGDWAVATGEGRCLTANIAAPTRLHRHRLYTGQTPMSGMSVSPPSAAVTARRITTVCS
jgi:hypothetical protein